MNGGLNFYIFLTVVAGSLIVLFALRMLVLWALKDWNKDRKEWDRRYHDDERKD